MEHGTQLADVLTDIFNIALRQAVIPRCFKATNITPVAKKSTVSCLNDYLVVALTSEVLWEATPEQLERPPHTSPFSIPNRSPDRSSENATVSALDLALAHLDEKDTYVKMLITL